MISELFRTLELVKVLDFLLDDPLSQYVKKDLAEGSQISRPTLDKLMPELSRLGILRKVRSLGPSTVFELDIKSPLVVSLIKFNSEIGKVFATRNIDSLNISKDYETYPDVIHMPISVKFEGDQFLKNTPSNFFTHYLTSVSQYKTTEKKAEKRLVDEGEGMKYLELETFPVSSEA